MNLMKECLNKLYPQIEGSVSPKIENQSEEEKQIQVISAIMNSIITEIYTNKKAKALCYFEALSTLWRMGHLYVNQIINPKVRE